jgi:hypothetical protein
MIASRAKRPSRGPQGSPTEVVDLHTRPVRLLRRPGRANSLRWCYRPARAAGSARAAWLLLGRSSHHPGARSTAADDPFRTEAATSIAPSKGSAMLIVVRRGSWRCACSRGFKRTISKHADCRFPHGWRRARGALAAQTDDAGQRRENRRVDDTRRLLLVRCGSQIGGSGRFRTPGAERRSTPLRAARQPDVGGAAIGVVLCCEPFVVRVRIREQVIVGRSSRRMTPMGAARRGK